MLMTVTVPTLFLIDDDPAIRRAMLAVGEMLHVPVTVFATAEEFLSSDAVTRPGCLVVDIKLPGMSGLMLQRRLEELDCPLPIIVISGHVDVPMAVAAMRHGATTVLTKPFRLEELLSHLREAFAHDLTRREITRRRQDAQKRLSELTAREREVLALIKQGLKNKQMAAKLNLTLRAVEDRRARLMRRLNVRSVAELLSLVQQSQS